MKMGGFWLQMTTQNDKIIYKYGIKAEEETLWRDCWIQLQDIC